MVLTIRQITNPDLYWSNTFGWTDAADADTFTEEEQDTLDLPMDGEWLDTAADIIAVSYTLRVTCEASITVWGDLGDRPKPEELLALVTRHMDRTGGMECGDATLYATNFQAAGSIEADVQARDA